MGKRVASILLLLLLPAGAATPNVPAPNIVLIVADDQSWRGTSVPMDPALSFSRSDYHQTPHLETLAAEGMRFSAAYVSPLCKPTQVALQTGKSWAQLQVSDDFPKNAGAGLTPPVPRAYVTIGRSELSMVERIKEANPTYRTGHFGKYANIVRNHFDFDVAVVASNLPKDVDPKGMFTFVNQANHFMEESVEADRPFFVEFTHDALKSPVEALPDTIDKYLQLPRGLVHRNPEYAAMTEDLDSTVGMVMEKIRDLGMEDNTYVIYTADNGAAAPQNVPLRGGKGSLWEGGIRVPLLIKGPGIEAGTTSHVPVIVMDLFTTITELAGATYPLHEGIEGASLVPILENGGKLPSGMANLRRTYAETGELFFHYTRVDAPQSAVIDGDFKLVKHYGNPGQPDALHLINLAEDPFEAEGLELASAMAEKTAELHEKLNNWLTAVDASLSYDVSAKTELVWNADDPGKQDDVELAILKASLGTNRPRSDLNSDGRVDEIDLEMMLTQFPKTWRSVTDVNHKDRETWRIGEAEMRPEHVLVESHQPHLPHHAFRFDRDDAMVRTFFQASDLPRGDVYDNDHSASFEYWLRIDSLTQPNLLFESGTPGKGLSITFGDADADGSFDEVRFRASNIFDFKTDIDDLSRLLNNFNDTVPVGDVAGGDLSGPGGVPDGLVDIIDLSALLADFNDEHLRIAATTEIDLFADPTRDFVQLVAVLSDDDVDRYAALYVNGALFGRTEGFPGSKGSVYWEGIDDAGLGKPAGKGLGGELGSGDLPLAVDGFAGDLGAFHYYNFAIDATTVLAHYNAALDDVDAGVAATAGAVRTPDFRPSDVREGALEADDTILLVHERHDRLDAQLQVDIVPGDGRSYEGARLTEGVSGTLAAGTAFSSYLLHFDPVGDPQSMAPALGTVTFEHPILGILLDKESLEQTDAILGSIGWYGFGSRGLDQHPTDMLSISDDLHTLIVSLHAIDDQVVQLRVLTELVPEPTSMAVLLAASVGLTARRRSTRSKAQRPLNLR